MKEERFIELLNLYVDQQLTAAEASELESEIQRNAARRSTYQQYCRMQRACNLLFEQECLTAPSSVKLARALADADRKIMASPNRRNVWRQRGIFAGGFAAMAACIAMVFVHQASLPKQANLPVASAPTQAGTFAVAEKPAATAPTVQTVVIPPADPQARSARNLYYSVLPVRQLVPLKVLVSDGTTTGEKPDFAWMKKVEMSPMRAVSADELLAGTGVQNQNFPANYGEDHPQLRTDVETTAFQVQKGN